ncbi:hypothetical protein FHG87_000328 [Trinorchestia longiramus]|nr:hypothetical protein FHG87_000328 [Trinorchestia longiramus]
MKSAESALSEQRSTCLCLPSQFVGTIDFLYESCIKVYEPNTRTQQKHVFDYKRANFELMNEELGSINYEVLMRNKNAEDRYSILKEQIATATEHHIPTK